MALIEATSVWVAVIYAVSVVVTVAVAVEVTVDVVIRMEVCVTTDRIGFAYHTTPNDWFRPRVVKLTAGNVALLTVASAE
jgi:hypothetical protein